MSCWKKWTRGRLPFRAFLSGERERSILLDSKYLFTYSNLHGVKCGKDWKESRFVIQTCLSSTLNGSWYYAQKCSSKEVYATTAPSHYFSSTPPPQQTSQRPNEQFCSYLCWMWSKFMAGGIGVFNIQRQQIWPWKNGIRYEKETASSSSRWMIGWFNDY